jgi:hypothetical protein
MTQSVDGRGVDPVDAEVQRLVDGGDGVAVVLAPQANSQPEPPMAQAPKPIGVMNRSEFPSCFVFMVRLSVTNKDCVSRSPGATKDTLDF